MAKKAFVFDGTNWIDIAQSTADLTGYPALATNQFGFRNKIINGDFRINQRAYTSASNLASGSYGFDRWKSSFTNTTLTFTSAPQGQSVTINSGGSIEQVIERENMPAGTYVLSWTGTATGRVYNTGATPPSYAASPVLVTLDGTANVEVEFTASGGTRTLQNVQLEAGNIPSAFERRPIGTELALCQRYYQTSFNPGQVPAHNASGDGVVYHPGVSGGISGNLYTNLKFSPMRTFPVVSIFNGNNASATPANGILAGGLNTSASGIRCYVSGGAGLDSSDIGIDYIRLESASLYAQGSFAGAVAGILIFGYVLNAEL